MGAPVCQISPVSPPLSAPNVLTPSIPIATSDNLVTAVNAIRAVLLAQTNQNASPAPPPANVGGGGAPAAAPQSQFIVARQVTQQVKVYDPNDPTHQTYVTVNQVTGLVMENQVTGQSWNWNATSNLPGSGGQ